MPPASLLTHAIELARRHGLKLGIEPEHGNVVRDVAAAVRLARELGDDTPVGFVLDCANLAAGRLDGQRRILDEAIEELGGMTLLAHAKDIDAAGNVTCPGEGAVDIPWFVAGLRRIGFDGAVIAHGFKAADTTRAGRYLSSLLAGTTP